MARSREARTSQVGRWLGLDGQPSLSLELEHGTVAQKPSGQLGLG